MGCTTGKMPKQKLSAQEIQEMKDARDAYLSCMKASRSKTYWSQPQKTNTFVFSDNNTYVYHSPSEHTIPTKNSLTYVHKNKYNKSSSTLNNTVL